MLRCRRPSAETEGVNCLRALGSVRSLVSGCGGQAWATLEVERRRGPHGGSLRGVRAIRVCCDAACCACGVLESGPLGYLSAGVFMCLSRCSASSMRARLSVYCNKMSGLVSHANPDSHVLPCLLRAQLAFSFDLVLTHHLSLPRNESCSCL